MKRTEPMISAETRRVDGMLLELVVPPGILFFEGHFPTQPVLPGVVQIHWALEFARTRLGVDHAFRSIEALKFQRVIVPGQSLTLDLDYRAQRRVLKFAYASNAGPHSAGRIVMQ